MNVLGSLPTVLILGCIHKNKSSSHDLQSFNYRVSREAWGGRIGWWKEGATFLVRSTSQIPSVLKAIINLSANFVHIPYGAVKGSISGFTADLHPPSWQQCVFSSPEPFYSRKYAVGNPSGRFIYQVRSALCSPRRFSVSLRKSFAPLCL